MRPASVCPTRIDNSSVANDNSWKWSIKEGKKKAHMHIERTLAKGIMERNETGGGSH